MTTCAQNRKVRQVGGDLFAVREDAAVQARAVVVQVGWSHFGNPFFDAAAAVVEKNPNVAADLSGFQDHTAAALPLQVRLDSLRQVGGDLFAVREDAAVQARAV